MPMKPEDDVTIRIKKKTRDLLNTLGTKQDTYDSVINMLIKNSRKK